MKIVKVNLFKFSLPLNKTLNMNGHLYKERNGLIIELIDSKQNGGYGEATPLPGLHFESVDSLIEQFKKIRPQIINLKAGYSSDNDFNLPECPPILNFAFEWAIIDLLSKEKKLCPAAILNEHFSTQIFINPILIGDIEKIEYQAKELKKLKPKSVKIKVGSRPLEDDIYLVKTVDDIFENMVNLRLDANRSWSLNQAVTFGHAVLSTNLEYIEEPIDNPVLLPEFYKKSGVQYALDETLSDSSVSKKNRMEGLAAFILKPAVLGSIKKIKHWIDLAKMENINCVFSNTFESGIGLWSNAHLAAAYTKGNVAHGLDTSSWLAGDLITPVFHSKNYKKVIIESEKFLVNKELLTPIDI